MRVNTWEQEQLAMPQRRWAFVAKPGPKLKTHCKRGHPYDSSNTIIAQQGARKGRRFCRACFQARRKAFAKAHPDLEYWYDRGRRMRRRINHEPHFNVQILEKPDTILSDWMIPLSRSIDGGTIADLIPSHEPDPLTALMLKEDREAEIKWKHIDRDAPILNSRVIELRASLRGFRLSGNHERKKQESAARKI